MQIAISALYADMNVITQIKRNMGLISAPSAEQKWIWSEQMNENKYYLKIDNRIIAERVSLEHALIFIKSIFENYYNDHEIMISIAEMKRYEDDDVD